MCIDDKHEFKNTNDAELKQHKMDLALENILDDINLSDWDFCIKYGYWRPNEKE